MLPRQIQRLSQSYEKLDSIWETESVIGWYSLLPIIHWCELIYVRVLIICFKWERIRETNFVEEGEHMYADAQSEESESEIAQSCLTLCDPMDCSLPGSSVHGVLQARIPEWVVRKGHINIETSMTFVPASREIGLPRWR